MYIIRVDQFFDEGVDYCRRASEDDSSPATLAVQGEFRIYTTVWTHDIFFFNPR